MAEFDELLFAALMAENAMPFCRALVGYLGATLGVPVRLIEDAPWQESERKLYRGEAHVGVVCGLQYVNAVDRSETPGVDVLAAPVMTGARYEGRPIYYSDVIVRRDHRARSLADLRGATWAYNEATSHSGYALMRYVLATCGERGQFFASTVASGAHLRSLELLLSGAIEATAIDSTVLEQELRLRPDLGSHVRVVQTLGPSPIPPVVVSRALPPVLKEALARALLSMHADRDGAAILSAAAIKQFVAITDAEYDPIRAMAGGAAELPTWPTVDPVSLSV